MRYLIAITLLLLAAPGWGANYCVKASGSATKANSIVANAAACTAAANSAAMSLTGFNANTFADGETVYFSATGGDYANLALVSAGSGVGNEIRYVGIADGTGGAYPTFTTSASAYPFSLNNKSNVIVSGMNAIYTGTNVAAVGIRLNGVISNVTLSNLTTNMGAYGYGMTSDGNATTITATDITISNVGRNPVYFYGGTNSGVTFRRITAAGPQAFDVRNVAGLTLDTITKTGSSGGYSDFTIQACSGTLHATGLSSTSATLYGVLVTDCTFDGVATSYLTGTFASSTNIGVSLVNSTGFTLLNSTISHAGGNGVTASGTSHDIDFIGNTVDHSAASGFWHTAGYNYRHVGNTVTFNTSDGMGTYNSTTPLHDVLYERNTITYNGTASSTTDGDGITAHYGDYNLTARYNLIYGNLASGLGMVGTSQGWAYNNTIVGNGNNNTPVRGGLYFDITGNNATTGTSWIVKNNIVHQNYPREIYMRDMSYVTLDYNLYYPVNASDFATINGGGGEVTWTQYHTSPNTYETHSNSADPKFRAASTNDFRLLSSSPARNTGDNTVWSGTANVTDFAGRPITDNTGLIVAPGGRR